jgi:F0F1-type ATP synthase assembly protein I
MKNRILWQNLHIVMQLGLTIAGSVVFCFFVGRYIDQLLGLRGIFTTLFILLGIVGGAVVAYRQIQTVLADDRKPGDEGKDE